MHVLAIINEIIEKRKYTMKSVEKFGERLSELMNSKELSSDKLGKIIGVNGSSVRRWCKGTLNIKLSKAVSISDYFACSLEFLFGRSEKKLDFINCGYIFVVTVKPCFDCCFSIG